MTKKPSVWMEAIRSGLIGGAASLLLCLVGMAVNFSGRYIISGVISMGQIFVIAPIIILAYTVVRRFQVSWVQTVLMGALAGFASGMILAALVLIGQAINLRAMFINASPDLYSLLTFDQSLPLGIPALLLTSTVIGAIGAALSLVPARWRTAFFQAVFGVILIGLLRDLLVNVAQNWGKAAPLIKWMFARAGLNLWGTLFVFVLVGGIAYWRYQDPLKAAPVQLTKRSPEQDKYVRWIKLAIIALVLVFLPRILGLFISDVLDTVGLFILMGLGLNIVVGFAGLLDLGYVAFWAIGAYMMGVLTSPELIAHPLNYWVALPIALAAAVFSGIVFGLPVLKMRGDYLAIVTLGFGEIVRLLVLSDWLRPWLGGTQGIQHIAYPTIGSIEFKTQQMLYLVILAFIVVAAFIAARLKDSRLGRSWMALREDEDVAKAMGINHVATKLLAFATGAFFAAMSGTLFAAKLQSAYPQSFQFIVSINVLSLIIIGGMGSIPGVVLGGLVLIGLPELLREFSDYRFLVYGAVLVAMMLMRPEGLIPEERRKLELHEELMEETAVGLEPKPVPTNPEGRS